eukprot:s744_g9.t1
MVAVLLGVFCSVTTARLVEEHLEEVLEVRTLKQAVEVGLPAEEVGPETGVNRIAAIEIQTKDDTPTHCAAGRLAHGDTQTM